MTGEGNYPSSAGAGGDSRIPAAGSKPPRATSTLAPDGRAVGYAVLTTDEECGRWSFGSSGSRRGRHLSRFLLHGPSEGIIVFHAFMKKTQQTLDFEIDVGRKRLKEILDA